MSEYLKPQSPIQLGDKFIYPLTTADQVIMENGNRLNTVFKSTVRKTVTLLANNWSADIPYTQTITFSDVNFDDLNVDAHVAYTGNKESDLELSKGYSCISYIKKDGNSITFSCLKDKPTIDMPVEIVGTSCDSIATVEEGSSDPVLQDKNVTPSTNPQSIVADEGFDGLGVVNIAAMPVKEQAIPSISVDSNGLITASATQSEGYVISGTKTGTKQLSVKSSNDLTASGATVTVPAGYYPSQSTKSVSTATQATPGISVSSSGLITASTTQDEGYVVAGTKSATKQLTTKDAATITPGTSNKTIAAGTYLTGVQTIAGDADLKAANIKKGVNIFGVAGSYDAVELNFKVVGGTTQPSNPTENTIWINTSNSITGYVFSATQPTGSTGMVWISIGAPFDIEFNALKENGIYVYPMSAKQYINGWVDKTTKIYQGGAWVDWWDGCLYNNGNEYKGLTGGYSAVGNYTSAQNTNGVLDFYSALGDPGAMLTVKAIDLTDFKTLYATGYSSNSSYTYFGFADNRSTNFKAKTAIGQSTGTYSIDISTYSGTFYVGLLAYYGTRIYINKIWLER